MAVAELQAWLAKPVAQKRLSLRHHTRETWNRLLPCCSLPLRLSPGLWWIARNDATSDELWRGTFERQERAFMQAFLRAGMVVIDAGAHAGFYSVLASKLVGPSGRVLAFEPSPRERRRLDVHLRLNRCANVTVEGVALGASRGEAELFVLEGAKTGCNSIHLADTRGTRPIAVTVRTLDEYLALGALPAVDFVKMDIEGAEMSALRGAVAMFRSLKPALLCELHEHRVAPWGYRARDIVDLLALWGYRWFGIGDDGRLSPLSPSRDTFFENCVALHPKGRHPLPR